MEPKGSTLLIQNSAIWHGPEPVPPTSDPHNVGGDLPEYGQYMHTISILQSWVVVLNYCEFVGVLACW
jgi:hypothetical protein